MPKDASKNVDRYKVRGGHMNEYDFEKEKAAEKKQDLTDKKPQKTSFEKDREEADKAGKKK